MVWYPIKDARTTQTWQKTLAAKFDCENLVSEWWLYPRDSRVSLNGSGVLILNPPYEFHGGMQLWLAELHAELNAAGTGGMSIGRLPSAA
jgi:23S rRNA (adenine2030-N6)-methyltransferase